LELLLPVLVGKPVGRAFPAASEKSALAQKRPFENKKGEGVCLPLFNAAGFCDPPEEVRS
jgi:hypothetical protein